MQVKTQENTGKISGLIDLMPRKRRGEHGLHDPPIRHQSRKKIRGALPQARRLIHRKAWLQTQDGRRCVGSGQCDHREKLGAYIDPQAGRRLVEDFWEPWLAAKKTKAKPSYIKSLEDAWRVHVEPQWGMRESAVNHTRRSAAVGHRSGRTAQRVRDDSRRESAPQSHGEAKADRCIHDNPCDGIELPRKQVRKHVYLSADELSRVAMQCGWREADRADLGPVRHALGRTRRTACGGR